MGITHRSKRFAISALDLRFDVRKGRRCSGGVGWGPGDRGKAEVAIAALPFDALVGVRLDEAWVSLSLERHDGLKQGGQEESIVKIRVQGAGLVAFED